MYTVETDFNSKVSTRKSAENKFYITNANPKLIVMGHKLAKFKQILREHKQSGKENNMTTIRPSVKEKQQNPNPINMGKNQNPIESDNNQDPTKTPKPPEIQQLQ